MIVTTRSMRHFAADCLQWAARIADPSQRACIIAEARHWAVIADALDRRTETARGESLPDLRSKLN